MRKHTKERRLSHNIGTHKERMALRRASQYQRIPYWAVALIAMFGIPPKKDRKKDFWEWIN